MKLDFHVHSTMSDGRYQPAEVLKRANQAGLKYLALADHDAISGYDEIKDIDSGICRVLAGVEFSVTDGDCERHILGYFPGAISDELRAFLADRQEERRDRAHQAVTILGERGIDIQLEDIEKEATGPVISRTHMAQALVRKGVVKTYRSAYEHLEAGGGAVSKPSVTAEEVIPKIADWGGVSVWAHPSVEDVEEHIDRFVECGLQGLEAFHRRLKGAPSRKIQKIATLHKLVVSGGSDWHGHRTHGPLKGISVAVDKIRPFLERVGMTQEDDE